MVHVASGEAVAVVIADWGQSMENVVTVPFDPPLIFPTDLVSRWPPTEGVEAVVRRRSRSSTPKGGSRREARVPSFPRIESEAVWIRRRSDFVLGAMHVGSEAQRERRRDRMEASQTQNGQIPLILIQGPWLPARSWETYADYLGKRPLRGVGARVAAQAR
jgi:hypothetical protein